MTTTMVLDKRINAPTWLKMAAAIGVLWYAYGLLQFFLAYSMEPSAAVAAGDITAAHGAAILQTPMFVWLCFAIASGAGLLGSFLMFSRSSAAKPAFAISLASATIYYGWIYLVSGTGADRPSEELIIAGVVIFVTLSFFVLSLRKT